MNLNSVDFNDLAVCALRYALGRKTYITYTISNLLIRHKKSLTKNTKLCILKDLKYAFNNDACGMEKDKDAWLKLYQELLGED